MFQERRKEGEKETWGRGEGGEYNLKPTLDYSWGKTGYIQGTNFNSLWRSLHMLFLLLEPLLSHPTLLSGFMTPSFGTSSGKPASQPPAVARPPSRAPSPLHASAPVHFHFPGDTHILPSAGSQLRHRDSVLLLCIKCSVWRGDHSINAPLKPSHLTRVTRLSFLTGISLALRSND